MYICIYIYVYIHTVQETVTEVVNLIEYIPELYILLINIEEYEIFGLKFRI